MERRGVRVVFHGQEKACNNNNYCDIFIGGQWTKRKKNNNNNENEKKK